MQKVSKSYGVFRFFTMVFFKFNKHPFCHCAILLLSGYHATHLEVHHIHIAGMRVTKAMKNHIIEIVVNFKITSDL